MNNLLPVLWIIAGNTAISPKLKLCYYGIALFKAILNLIKPNA